MKEQGYCTSGFNKSKRVEDVWKKAIEKEEMNRPPPALEAEAMKRKITYQGH